MPRGWIVLVAALLASCATPADRFDRRANALGFAAIGLQGTEFHHVAYVAGALESSDTLHVYVEHDGTPWLDLTHPEAELLKPMPAGGLSLEQGREFPPGDAPAEERMLQNL